MDRLPWGLGVHWPLLRGKSRLRELAAVALILFVAGCAGAPSIPYDASSTNPVKTIGLLTPGGTGEPRAVLATTVGQSFGLIGAIIDAGMQESRETALKSELGGQQFDAEKTFTDSLTKSLECKGYKVVLIPMSRGTDLALEKTYPGSSQTVDAYLDTTFTYGVIAAGIAGSTPYRPFTYADCRLVKASDSSVLMEDSVFYNILNAPKGRVVLAPDPAYAFKDFDAVTADPEKTTKGITVAVASTTDAIAKLLQ